MITIPRSRSARALLVPVLWMTMNHSMAADIDDDRMLAYRSDMLEEVVVTAQKREQNLQDVPVSITAFTEDDILAGRIRNAADYVARSPNVSYQDTGEIGWSQIVIRGVQNFGGDVNAFGVYVDEFNLAPSSFQITVDPELQDIERLEVLRGPQGVAFGRNVIAGAVNITTKKPGNDFESDFLLDYGTFDTYTLKAGVSVPVVEDVLAMRLTGFHAQSDGPVDDIGPANNDDDSETTGGRLALRFTGIDRLTADASITLSRKSRGLPSAVPGPLLPSDSLLFGPFFGASPPIDGGEGVWPENEDRVSTNFPTDQDIDTSIYQLRLSYDLDAASLISITGYIDADYSYLGEADMTAGDYTYIDEFRSLESFSQELRLQSADDGGRFDWLVGLIYSDDESASEEAFGGGVDGWAGINVIVEFVANPARLDMGLPPLPLFPETPAPLNTFGGAGDTESYGAFAEFGYDVSDRLSLTAGARYTHDTIETTFYRFGDFTPPGLLAGALEPFRFDGMGKTTYDAVTPRLTAVFAATDAVNLYAAASRGYKSGGFNAQAAAFANDVEEFDFNFEPEKAWNYEGGIKADLLGNRLRVNAAVFHIDWNDVQVTAFDVGTLSSLTQNAAKATSSGAEAEIIALPAPGLTFSAAAGYLDAEVDEFSNAVVDGAVVDVSGNRLPYAPEWSVNASASYEMPVPAWSDTYAFLRIEYGYRSSQFDDIANRPEDELPSYSLWNARLGIERGRFRLTAYGENLFEEDYHLSPSDVQARLPLSGDLIDVHPRIFGIELSYRY